MKSIRESGRSMVEMLGVLAIVGVLSVGAIAGYSKAMDLYKTNRLISDYYSIVFGILAERRTDWNDTRIYAPTLNKLHLWPSGWDANTGTDRDGNYWGFQGFMVEPDLSVLSTYVHLKGTNNIYNKNFCIKMINSLLKPNIDAVHSFFMSIVTSENGSTSYTGNVYYNNKKCNKTYKNCISDITMAQANAICEKCITADSKMCRPVIRWNWAY